MSFPQWQTNQTNIERTNAVIRTIAYQFQHNSQVVSAIAALNEYVQSSTLFARSPLYHLVGRLDFMGNKCST